MDGTEQRDRVVADLAATIACLRIVGIVVAYLIEKDDHIGPHLIRVLRDQIPEAAGPEEVKVLDFFVEGVERHMGYHEGGTTRQ